MDNLAILIPAYNESQTIQKVVKDVLDVTKEIENTTIYVYDNNSSDETAKLAIEAGAVVRTEFVQGKGAVIRRMFREINAKAYIMIDADDTYPVDAIPDMYAKIIDKKVDMVVGDRLSSTYFNENKRPFHNVGNVITRKLINLLFKSDIKDILTGFRAFSFEFVKTFPITSRGFEIETEMSIHAAENHLFVNNQIIDYRDRPDGSESKLNTYSDGLKVIRMIFKLYRVYHPNIFFGSLAGILILINVLFFIWRVWIPYSQTGVVSNLPTLIVTMIFFVISVVSFFSGMILSSNRLIAKQDFEIRLIDANERKNKMQKNSDNKKE